MRRSDFFFFLLLVLLASLKITFIPSYLNISISASQLAIALVTSVIIHFILFSFTLRLKTPYLFLLFYISQFLYLLVNIYAFLYFDTVVHLNYIHHLFWESVVAVRNIPLPYNPVLLFAAVDAPLALYVVMRYRFFNEAITSMRHYRAMLCGSFTALAAIYVAIYAASPPLKLIDNELIYDKTAIARYGLVAHNMLDLLKDSASPESASHVTYSSKVVVQKRAVASNNIVMIQFESLDANIIDCKYHGKYIAPFLHDLSSHSIYYPYTLSYRRAGGTSDCEIAVLNSIKPLENEPLIKSNTYHYPNSMVKSFAKEGYDSVGFHGNSGGYYNRTLAYPEMGFSKLCDIGGMNLQQQGWGASDGDVLDYVRNKLLREKQPFFYYIVTMSSHEPFTNVTNYYSNHSYDDIEFPLVRRYFRSISYCDGVLKDFITSIRKRYCNCYIFIYGDHTPYVINQGPYRRASVLAGRSEMEFVPLIILTPDNRVHYEKTQVASYLDLAPTALAASGIKYKIQSSGINLLNPIPQGSTVPYFDNDYQRSDLYRRAGETAYAAPS